MTPPTASFEKKIRPPEELQEALRTIARPLVFTNGVFDLLHRGHATYLDQARSLGVSLLVALNSDESVRRLGKDVDRPINTLSDRAAVIAALEAVSLVTWFEEDTPLELILRVKPQILVKGGDWPVEQMVGAREIQQWQGVARSIPFEFQQSTTAMLRRIRGKS